MDSQIATGQSMAAEIKQSVIDYGPNVGLNLGQANPAGSLSRIQAVLSRASRSPDVTISTLASHALEAVTAYEEVNGTKFENEHREAFASLASTAESALKELFDRI